MRLAAAAAWEGLLASVRSFLRRVFVARGAAAASSSSSSSGGGGGGGGGKLALAR